MGTIKNNSEYRMRKAAVDTLTDQAGLAEVEKELSKKRNNQTMKFEKIPF